MTIDEKEAVRYLGYRNHEPDEKTCSEIRICSQELLQAAAPKSRVIRVPVTKRPDGVLQIGELQVDSADLAGHLRGCKEAFLFAATLGAPVDRLLRRYSVTAMSRAVILQACAAAAIESYCDELEEDLRQKVEAEGLFLRPRYSPGYGDFPVQQQPELLRILDAPRQIGLTATDSCMLVPTKSVTAIIGLTTDKTDCHIRKCMDCKAKACPFRRE